MRARSVLPSVVKIASHLIIVIALAASPRSFAVEQASDVPAWLAPNVGDGEGQIAQVVLQRARALYFPKSARRCGEKSLLFCHGRDASRLERWQIGPAVLRCLRIPPIVPCNFGGSRRGPQFEGCRKFRQRKAVREEFRQCGGFATDRRRAM